MSASDQEISHSFEDQAAATMTASESADEVQKCESDLQVVASAETLVDNLIPTPGADRETYSKTDVEENTSTHSTPTSNNEAPANEDKIVSNSAEAPMDDMGIFGSRDGTIKLIANYMELAKNKENHAQLLQETTTSSFLVLCLGAADPSIVEYGFEVCYALSKFKENLPLLRKVVYMMDALREVARNPSIKSCVRKNATVLLGELKRLDIENKEKSQPLSEKSESDKNVMMSNSTAGTSAAAEVSRILEGEKAGAKPVDLNTTMSTMKRKNKGRETILFVDNHILLQKSERAKVTQALIGVPGIISVTYDVKKSFCIVRGKRTVSPEEFGRAVAALGLASVYLVRKNENKEEVKILIQVNEQENVHPQYPPYPEELEVEEADNSAAVARKDAKSDNPSLFKSAKNFIKRSFYW